MSRRLIHILLNPFFQALVVAAFIIVILPLRINKYYAELKDATVSFDKTQVIFNDLDNDGISERINTFHNVSGNVGITIFKGTVGLGQWNFKGIYQIDSPRLMIGDYDHDKLDEIFIFTLVEDSVMLHAMKYSHKPDFILRDRFIDKIGKNLKNPDHKILPGEVVEMTGDHFDDLVFAINTGFSKQPRNVYIYDIAGDLLAKSPVSGAFISRITMADLDGDEFKEILPSTYAASNFNQEPFIYTDTSCWLMALDHNLQFMFAPVEFPGAPGTLELDVLHEEVHKIIGKYSIGSPTKRASNLFLADIHGRILKKKELSTSDIYFTMGLLPGYINKSTGMPVGIIDQVGLFSIDENLEIKPMAKMKYATRIPTVIDIDNDGNEEIIALAPDHERHMILRTDFSQPVMIDFPVQAAVPVFSVKLNGMHTPQISVQGDRDWKLFDYGINPVYRFRFLIWMSIYLGILGFILLIRKLYSFQLQKRYETEKKIATLQLSSVKAQMEPHFIMNTINTIGSSIYRQKPDEAYNLLLNFSGMVRSLLVSSDKLTRTLKEELEFVKNYLDLEKTRFGEVFSYTIHDLTGIDQDAIIPKMIIQLHVENALKHGLIPKKAGGLLDISIENEKEHLVITITDNGIGRNMASKNISQSTGRGMKILGQFFETYNKYNKVKLKQEIIDLYGVEDQPAGTMVKIFVPQEFNEGIY